MDRAFGPALMAAFDRLHVINLPERADRRRQMERQLRGIGLSLAHPKVALHVACRPETAAGFPSVGAHGCYLSHLAVLREARDRGLARVLVAEDDLDFRLLDRQAAGLVPAPDGPPWDLFHPGYLFPERFLADGTGLVDVGSRYTIGGTHLYGVSGRALGDLVAFLEALLAGPAPRPHYDEALSAFRAARPGCVTLVASPAFGIQRRSRSDVQRLRFHDRVVLLRPLADLLRRAAGRRDC